MEILGADPADRETAARAFLAWLEPKANAAPCRWLVVLDDVTDPADLNGLYKVLYRAGRSLGEAGQVTAATAHFHRLTQTTGHRLGPDHPATLTARSHLARWRGKTGDAAGAAAAYEQLLVRMSCDGEVGPIAVAD
ncbi:hypothetical protein [Streptomyces sp. NPDC001450]